MSCCPSFCKQPWFAHCSSLLLNEGREGKGKEGKGREEKGKEGKGREGKGDNLTRTVLKYNFHLFSSGNALFLAHDKN